MILATPEEFEETMRRIVRDEVLQAINQFPQRDEQQDSPDEILGVAELAELAGVTPSTIYHRSHEIPFSKQGKRLYITKKDAVEWLMSNRRETKQEAMGRLSRQALRKEVA